MNENDFYVAIQGICEAAKDAGWSLDKIDMHGTAAVEEFIGTYEAIELDDIDDEG